MIRFDKEKVLLLHQILIEQTGGEDGVRDMGLLESALAACDATFATTLLWTETNASASM